MEIEQTVMFLNYLFDGVFLADHDRSILFWNHSAEVISGYTSSEVVGRKCYDMILLHVNEKGENICNSSCPLKQTIKNKTATEMSLFLRHKQGHLIPVTIRTVPIFNDNGLHKFTMETFTKNNSVGNFDQVRELARKAFLDSLSGLPNKEYIDSKLSTLLASEAIGDSNILGLFFIHLDNLKQINNDYGIAAGNMSLKAMGKVLSDNIQEGDIIGRLEGGLFIMITRLDKKSLMLNWSNKLKSSIEKVIIPGHESLSMKICIGGIITPLGESLEDIYHILDEELKVSRDVPINVSVRGLK
ncbi:diguanylate cyclase domain-containing protein [Pelosinus sp. sgz500959]|uniref:diguanylate cyclase domain-containing protein n=1 Tax=Pelosinus sp. sgz500959 TaxID=3242472 RepID=UPI00366CE137